MPAETYDVIVLGAGPAGLATALEVAERGFRVALLERESVTGGMAGSFDVGGTRVDFGSHRLHPVTPPAVLARLTRLLGDDLQTRTRRGRLRLGSRWVAFPLKPADLARSMPRAWLLGVLRDTFLSPLRARGASRPTSYADSLRGSLGPTAYDTLYAPYAEKLWGLPGEQIDPEQARVRVSADTVPKVAVRVARSSVTHLAQRAIPRLQRRAAPRGSTFLYPRRGFGQIVESLEAAARQAGVHIVTDATVTSITPPPVSSATATRSTDTITIECSDGTTWQSPTVLSTLPIPLLARLADPSPPTSVVEDAKALKFRAMVLVYLAHERPQWSSFDAHYLPGAGTPITRISEPSNYRDSADDPSDRSVICVEIPCAVDDGIWTATDDDLSAVVHRAIEDFDLPPLDSSAIESRRLRSVYPIYEHGFAPRLARLENWADGIPGVTTLGRSGLFAHDNTHHALIMAAAVADSLDDTGRLNKHRWREARESFRTHVVED